MTGVPPGRQCTLPRCEREAIDPARPGSLCAQHLPADTDAESTNGETEIGDQNPEKETDESGGQSEEWDSAEFTAPETNVWPPAWEEREFWMARQDKMPYAPWNDSWKWSNTENWADKATVDEWVESDPRTEGHVAILEREDDPYTDDPDAFAFIDGDDVRCPESGEVHPQFVAVLERLGITYADVSTSGSGVHALYVGKLPSGYKQADFAIDDEPWGANDDIPEIEIYDGKRVCVVTGEHVPGTPLNVNPWDDEELTTILEERVDAADKHETEGHDTDRERPELDAYEPTTTGEETTEEIHDVFYAIEQLRPRDLPLRTRQVGTDATGWEKWDPSSYRPSSGGDSLHRPPNEAVFHDHKTGHAFGLLSLFAAEQGIISKPWHSLEGAEFWEAVTEAREAGAPIPEYVGWGSDDEDDLTDLDVTLDPAVAWRAASTVTPDDVDSELTLETTDDGKEWRCPATSAAVDIVRAVALDEGLITQADGTLRDADYDSAYRRAREQYDAPLPEYVTAATATDRWAVIQGALEQLTHRHFSTIKSDVTGLAKGDENVVAEINPCWTESGSERRVIALDNGVFHCREHMRTLDPLRFAALESGVIDECGATLAGEEFKLAYHTAREEYGAPLPEWNVGDPEHIPILPPSEELVGEFATDTGSLQTAREDVEELYRNLAGDNGTPYVLNALPALGKTTSVVKNADKHPALYLGPRKELQEEVAQKAEKWGVSWMYLPVFAERHVDKDALNQALAIVREEGKDVLKDREALVEQLDHAVFAGESATGSDEIVLNRASCPTANGEHGEAWALAFQVARKLGHTPREILTRGEALFGDKPPTSEDEDPYSQAWKRATDPDAPIDLLIGGYGHAHVGGARTYYHKRNDRPARDPRTVAVDEFPGLDPYESTYGERYLDHAAWLARCLREDVDDRQALFEQDLWSDEWVRAWLRGAGGNIPSVKRATTALSAMQDGLEVLNAIDELRQEYRGAVRSLGLEDVLGDIMDCHPVWEHDPAQRAFYALSDAVQDTDGDSGTETALLDRIAEDVLSPLRSLLSTLGEFEDELAASAIPDCASGDLLDLCTTTCEMFSDRRDSAHGVLDTARTALEGGEDGCRALALHARDGYAHPDAHLLLYGQIADCDETTTVRTETYTFGADDETNLKRTTLGQATVLVDRNHHGALVHQPPEFVANDGSDCPVVGLDATANSKLWSLALGQDVEIADIHDSATDRRQFLHDVLNLQVVQTSEHVNTYSGATATKNFDGDVELVNRVAEEYVTGLLRQDTLTTTTAPGVITTKKVEEEIGDRLEGRVSVLDHYGNVTGSNAMNQCNLGVILGARHYGDRHVEKWAALAGEEVMRSGRGADLDYSSETANAVLQHMREDETMQAILRFGRDEEGAIVFAHTSALRDDLPVIGEGAVVQAHSANTIAVAQAAREHRGHLFTVGDLVDKVDCSRRTIRRALAGFVDQGNLDRHETKNGVANEYYFRNDPGVGEVELPDVDAPQGVKPDTRALNQYYTWSVRVEAGESARTPGSPRAEAVLPAPDEVVAGPPPG